MTTRASRRRLLGVVAIVAGVAGCGVHSPTITENPLSVPADRTDIVSVCYDSGDHSRTEIEALALAKCPEKTVAVTAWRVDRIINDCPLLKKSRVSLICVPPRSGY